VDLFDDTTFNKPTEMAFNEMRPNFTIYQGDKITGGEKFDC